MERLIDIRKLLKLFGFVIIASILLILYKKYDPILVEYFPRCPFKFLTGYDCPGCGAQRSIHSLLSFNFSRAFNENALLIISIPYLLIGFIFDFLKPLNPQLIKVRSYLFGQKAIYVILIAIIFFWITRNL